MLSPSPPLAPQDSKRSRKPDLAKPNESWFLILVNAFKSNFEQTLTYKESELYSWIMQAYPYYRHDMHTMQTSVKTTLSSYECFRQNGRSTWTFIPRRALSHLESLKSEDGRAYSDHLDDNQNKAFEEEDEDVFDDNMEANPNQGNLGSPTLSLHASHSPHPPLPQPYPYEHPDHSDPDKDMASSTRIRFVDRHVDLMDTDSPTLSAEEIQRFKQEHSAAVAKKLKRKASGGHPIRPRTRSPPARLQDECSMSVEAWCNLLVQMFEASPKQKTIREIYAWVHDNYPVYRNSPDDMWHFDLTAALETNPLFRAMGRGRWQMATQPIQPVVILNGGGAGGRVGGGVGGGVGEGGVTLSGTGTPPMPEIKEEGNASDSPSVTEDEDWKAIGSKRLLNYSFRRYSIATDTFPKSHYKVGSTTSANTSSLSNIATPSTTAIATASGNSPLTATTSGGKLLPVDPRGMGYSTGRRFSSYHQPTPKNSPPLSASTSGLPNADEFSLQLKSALAEEVEDEDPGKRYMAPLQSAITTAVLALQQSQQAAHLSTKTPLHPLHEMTLGQDGSQSQYAYPPCVDHVSTPTIKIDSSTDSQPHPQPCSQQPSSPSASSSCSSSALHNNQQPPHHPRSPHIISESPAFNTQSICHPSLAQEQVPSIKSAQTPGVSVDLPGRHSPLLLPHSPSQAVPATSEVVSETPRPDSTIVIPNGETLATDQMDAIQALALLVSGGV
ncbi:hypothetical protein BG004_006548 [Podila humilis]|nr:hypothetical protein BG004_006548 [Podila humilis]